MSNKKIKYIFRKEILEKEEQNNIFVNVFLSIFSGRTWVDECDGHIIKFKKNKDIAEHYAKKGDLYPYTILKKWCEKVED